MKRKVSLCYRYLCVIIKIIFKNLISRYFLNCYFHYFAIIIISPVLLFVSTCFLNPLKEGYFEFWPVQINSTLVGKIRLESFIQMFTLVSRSIFRCDHASLDHQHERTNHHQKIEKRTRKNRRKGPRYVGKFVNSLLAPPLTGIDRPVPSVRELFNFVSTNLEKGRASPRPQLFLNKWWPLKILDGRPWRFAIHEKTRTIYYSMTNNLLAWIFYLLLLHDLTLF